MVVFLGWKLEKKMAEIMEVCCHGRNPNMGEVFVPPKKLFIVVSSFFFFFFFFL